MTVIQIEMKVVNTGKQDLIDLHVVTDHGCFYYGRFTFHLHPSTGFCWIEWPRGCGYTREALLESLAKAKEAGVLISGTMIGIMHLGEVERLLIRDSVAEVQVATFTSITTGPAAP